MDPEVVECNAGLRESVLDRAGDLLARVLGEQDVPAVSASTPLREGMTSATILELLLELEEALGIEVDVENLDEPDTATFGALADFVATHSRPAG